MSAPTFLIRLRVHYPLEKPDAQRLAPPPTPEVAEVVGEAAPGSVRVHTRSARMVIRTEADWDADVAPVRMDPEGTWFDFELRSDKLALAFKPCIIDADELIWSAGTNKLAFPGNERVQNVYPHFSGPPEGRLTGCLGVPSLSLQRDMNVRVYLPSGYDDNVLKRFPVVYMHDGKNLFFPEEAFLGRQWQVDETLDVLSCMNLIDQTIVVGIHAGDRMNEYTGPGLSSYGRAIVEELIPVIDRSFRTLSGPRRTAVMGSSLGGVASLHLAWNHPQIFGLAACLSSTFGYRDDLLSQVRNDAFPPRRHLKFYLDSGWPGDNYEVTLAMAGALVERGFLLGRDVLHLAFPHHRHDEDAWAARLHIPLQMFSGKVRRAAERWATHSASPEEPVVASRRGAAT